MHVRVRLFGKPEAIVAVESKLTKIEKFRRLVRDKFNVAPQLQRLFYGGKLLEDGYTLFDYSIKLNDVIQVMQVQESCLTPAEDEATPEISPIENDVKPEPDDNDNIREYKDAVSVLYEAGDLVDIRDAEAGSWFEGKIVQIVIDPDASVSQETETNTHSNNLDSNTQLEGNNTKKEMPLFMKTAKVVRMPVNSENNVPNVSQGTQETDVNLLYKVQREDSDDTAYAKLNEIRPRARNAIEVEDLKVGQKVMINYNIESPNERGYWYDMKISEKIKMRRCFRLSGTLYLENDGAVTQYVERALIRDKIFKIENAMPLAKRTNEYKDMMKIAPEKRSKPLLCRTCSDNDDKPCKDCGCFTCEGKNDPSKIILCDECDKGYHMSCLVPPMEEIPNEDWYCPLCKRDPNEIVAPGASKQKKRTTKEGGRDWGRGMACIGKTKDCSLPPNHFGPIPGVEVGMKWRFRIQLSEIGLHRPPVSGIHGRDIDGAYSLVLSGGYEDDVDYGFEFTYTGSGGRDLSGNRRTAMQSSDQKLTRENRALARNCAVPDIVDTGGDAGENWREGKPVRVSRSYKMWKLFPKYSPKEGLRYDGIYKVVKYYPETGQSGFLVWKYLLRRDDPSPAPWEPGAKMFTIVYPDNYLEAEAEKKRLKALKTNTKKTGKRALKENNTNAGEAALDIGDTSNGPNNTSSDSNSTTANSDNNTSVNNDENRPPKRTRNKKRATRKAKNTEDSVSTSSEESLIGFLPQDKSINTSERTEQNPEQSPVSNNSINKSPKEKNTEMRNFMKIFFKKSPDSSKSNKKGRAKKPGTTSDESTSANGDETEHVQEESIPQNGNVSNEHNMPQVTATKHTSDKSSKLSKEPTSSESSKKTKLIQNTTLKFTSNKTRTVSEKSSSSKSTENNQSEIMANGKHAAKKRPLEKYKSSSEGSPTAKKNQPSRKRAKRDVPKRGTIEKVESQSESEDTLDKQTANMPLAAGNKAETPNETVLDDETLEAIKADVINVKKWEECLDIAASKGTMEFFDKVMETFRCAVCQNLVKTPLTTPCLHNFCTACLNQVFKFTRNCPCCRNSLNSYNPHHNMNLTSALKCILGESVVDNRVK